MENTKFIAIVFILAAFIFLPDRTAMGGACKKEKRTSEHIIDSITTNWAQSNVTYYGVRIWPQNENSLQKSKESRLYLALGMHDTLTVISDHPMFFDAKMFSIKSKGKAKKIFSAYNLDFDEDIPISIYVTSSSDTLVYRKTPIKSAPYEFEEGILKTNRLSGFPIYAGMPVSLLNKKAGTEEIIPTETLSGYRVICIIHPDVVRSSWVDRLYARPSKKSRRSDISMVILKLKDSKIETVEYTHFGKHHMRME